ncbi:MAG: FecR family protein [Anaerolineae bacterium]
MVLGSAFAVFCALAVSTPVLATRYVSQSARENKAELTTVSGTAQMLEPGATRWIAVSGTDRVSQGTVVQADASSRAMIQVYEGESDYVLAMIHVFSDTRLTLERSTTPRFGVSDQPNRITVRLAYGRVRLNPGPLLERDIELKVAVPGGEVLVEDGSVAVEATADSTELAVRSGRTIITIESTGEQLLLEMGERAVLASDGSLTGPLPAGRDLIVNSDFAGGLSMSWETYNDQGGDGGTVDGQVQLMELEGERSVRFERVGGQNDHCETGVRQVIRTDVTDYVSLRIRLDLRLLDQSLSGGGFQGSEFPLMVRLNYRDAQGNLQFWTWGFYYENPGNYPTPLADMIERDVWFPFESPDLMSTLGDTKPAYLESIQVYSSGHDYRAEVGEVQLVVE